MSALLLSTFDQMRSQKCALLASVAKITRVTYLRSSEYSASLRFGKTRPWTELRSRVYRMPQKTLIPITAITVFGASSLLAIAVAIVLYLGFDRAAESTRQLLANQSKTLIDSIEDSLDSQLKPIREQARWVAKDIHDVSSLSSFDEYIFGVLAATPQVVGVAIVTADGQSRRWHRSKRIAIDQDWSTRPGIPEWLKFVEAENRNIWREPIWAAEPVSGITLLHDVPLHNEAGEFIGVFAQIVPIVGLSSFLFKRFGDTGLTPFVLYDKQSVLLHPMLINEEFSSEAQQRPLPTLESLGDLILGRIWTPDETEPFISEAMSNTEASVVLWGEDYYIYVYRDIDRYGPAPWTIGAYINTSLHAGGEIKQLLWALLGGLAVMLVAVAVSVYAGRKVSSPIKAIARAAEKVEKGSFGTVKHLASSRIKELDEASSAFNNMVKGLSEREMIRETLGRFVPEEVANSLLAGGGKIHPQQTDATILFCDIESFTQLTESLGPVNIVALLNAYFSAMVEILEQHGGVVTQFQGDAILATFNVPLVNPDHAANAVHAAREMLERMATRDFADESLNIRVGINTGPVVAGAIGAEGRLNYTVHGDAVNLAARLEGLNKQYGTRLLVSGNTVKLVAELEFSRVGESSVRGQSQPVSLYTLASLTGEQTD